MDVIREFSDTNTNTIQTHSWDEWADVTRLLKFNETNIALQKALQSQSQAAQAASASSSKAAKASAAKDASAAGRGLGRKDGARGTKRGREEVSRPVPARSYRRNGRSIQSSCVALQDEGTRKPEMKLIVPEPLKVLLVDDWEAVTKNNHVRVCVAGSGVHVCSCYSRSVGWSAAKAKRGRASGGVQAICPLPSVLDTVSLSLLLKNTDP